MSEIADSAAAPAPSLAPEVAMEVTEKVVLTPQQVLDQELVRQSKQTSLSPLPSGGKDRSGQED